MFKVRLSVFSICFINVFLLAFFVCANVDAQNRGGAPDWVRDPYQRYNRQSNVAATGMGNSRQAAEKDALARLAAIFGQSIQVDEKISQSYRESVNNGAAVWSENNSMDSTISTSINLDALVGAEIGDTWDNGKEYYAVAFMNKSKSAPVYSDMIRTNLALIDNLVNIPETEKNTLDGYAHYQFAGAVADITAGYRNVLAHIGSVEFAQGLKSGNDYRLEAKNIIKAIPVGIRVKNDKSGRIEGAFAGAFAGLGFGSGGANSRYVLEVDVIISPVEIPKNPNKFVRMELNANLTDTVRKVTLLPYNYLNNREGHATQAEAENRIYTAAEQKISEEYFNLLNEYILRLIPEKK